jgi:hypothetical protein
VLSEHELRQGLIESASFMGDQPDRAVGAIRLAHRQKRRRLRRVGATIAVVVAGLGVGGALSLRSPADAPPAVAAIACQPGRTVAETPVVAALPHGAVIVVTNNTGGSVAVTFDSERAVLPPGLTEIQLAMATGTHRVQCLTSAAPTSATTIDVVAGL